jgi:hypothetical protein
MTLFLNISCFSDFFQPIYATVTSIKINQKHNSRHRFLRLELFFPIFSLSTVPSDQLIPGFFFNFKTSTLRVFGSTGKVSVWTSVIVPDGAQGRHILLLFILLTLSLSYFGFDHFILNQTVRYNVFQRRKHSAIDYFDHFNSYVVFVEEYDNSILLWFYCRVESTVDSRAT